MPLPPDPVAFVIPYLNREVFWYGILVTLGVLAAAFVSDREARRRGQNPDHVWNALIVVMVFGLLGARIYHVVSAPAEGGSNLADYLQNPMSIINVWDGGLRGLGVVGAVIGGAIGLGFYVWEHNHRVVTNMLRAIASPFVRALGRPHLEKRRTSDADWLHFAEWADIAALGLPLGQAIGRWGNYVNQELYGYQTDLPWGVPVGTEHRLASLAALPEDARFHPSFLYESLWCLLVFVVLLFITRRWSDRLLNGDVALLYLILYPAGRILVEFQRPDAWTWSDVPVAQVIGLAMMFVAGVVILLRHGFHQHLRGNVAEV